MSPFSNILRGAGQAARAGAGAVKKAMSPAKAMLGVPGPAAVQAAVPALAEAPASMAPPQDAAPAGQTAPQPFALPDLGPGPQEADPQYADAPGKEKYARDLSDYQHKQFIHDQFTQLAQIMGELHPQRDFEGEYKSDLAAMDQHAKERPG